VVSLEPPATEGSCSRVKKSGRYEYLQIVHNERVEGRVRQRVIATLGRLDVLKQTGQLEGLLDSLARFSDHAAVLNALRRKEIEPVRSVRIGGRATYLWDADKLSALVDPNGSRTTLAYALTTNRTQRLQGIVDPDGSRTSFLYDTNDRVKSGSTRNYVRGL